MNQPKKITFDDFGKPFYCLRCNNVVAAVNFTAPGTIYDGGVYKFYAICHRPNTVYNNRVHYVIFAKSYGPLVSEDVAAKLLPKELELANEFFYVKD